MMRAFRNHSHNFALAAVITLLVCASSVLGAERPSHYGVSPAYPKDLPDSVAGFTIGKFGTGVYVSAHLMVDKKGKVKDVIAHYPADTTFEFQTARPVLMDLRFEPGRINGKKKPQTIPVRFRCKQRGQEAHFDFPVDTSLRITDPVVYFETIRLNGGVVPAIEWYPSYFYKPDTTGGDLKDWFVLAKVDIDSSGAAISIEPVMGEDCAFADQALTAANWAKYVPGGESDNDHGGENFLLVSFYPGVTIPTFEVTEQRDSLELFDRIRVRLFPDSVGLMTKPVPRKFLPGGVYSLPTGGVRNPRSIKARVVINAHGQVTQCHAIGADLEMGRVLRKTIASLGFYPALDFMGEAHPFEGMVVFDFVTSAKVRIRFCWLEGECD